VTMVILSHLPPVPRDAAFAVLSAGDWFRHYGGLGVDLFFVLSGFLVSGLLFREYRATGTVRTGRFLIRRGFKIYPAFYVFGIATVLLRLRAGDTLTRADIAAELLFVQNYGPHVWSHTWSLAVEEHFYLLLALLVVLLSRWVPRDPFKWIPSIFVATTAAVFIARAATFMMIPFSNETHRFPTHLEIDSLFFGVLLSHWYHQRAGLEAAVRRHAPALLVAATASIVLAQTASSAGFRYLAGHLLTTAGFGAVVLLAVAVPPQRGAFARRVALVGAQSYSIYLWHAAVMAFGTLLVARMVGHPVTFYETIGWYVPGSFVVGLVMAKCVEVPSLRIRERLFPDGRPIRAAETPFAVPGSASV
jgi:peptidoglycan/LPS O-acetylase OafA/YrhL